MTLRRGSAVGRATLPFDTHKHDMHMQHVMHMYMWPEELELTHSSLAQEPLTVFAPNSASSALWVRLRVEG